MNDHSTTHSTGPTTRMSVIEGCRHGDNQAWTAFFNIYAPIVYRYGRHAGLSENDTEEVVAKVMGNFMQALRRGFAVDHNVGRFRQYLRSAANHEISGQRRRIKNHAPLEDIADPPSSELPPEECWANLERQERLRLCLDRLRLLPEVSLRDLLAFHRYALHNEPAELVAKDLIISKSRLYAIKHEIIQHLRDLRVELDVILEKGVAMFFNRCPTVEALYQYALKPDSSRTTKHLESCEKCRAALAEIRKDEQLLNELRATQGSEVDDRVRERLLKICRGVAATEGRGEAERH